MASVQNILDEIDHKDKPTLMVFNKIDAYEPEVIEEDDLVTEKTKAHYTLQEWKKTWMNTTNGDAIFISAINKENFEAFRKIVYEKVKEIHITRFPYNHFLYDEFSE